MDSTVKSLVITGTAAEDATRSRLTSRRKRTVIKDDDDFTESVKNFSMKALPTLSPAPLPVAKATPLPVLRPTPLPVVTPQPIQSTSVILKPLKQPRVKLQPKVVHEQAQLNVTRKARRIKLNVHNLTHRFTRAKKLKDETEKKPMESIRGYLVQKGVIQEKSKAPEKMLRSMYADFMLLKDQAL